MTGALAGCLGDDGDGNGDADIEYTNWLYAPGELNQNHYFFTFIDDTAVRANEDNFEAEFNESEQTERFPLTEMGVNYGAVEARVSINLGRGRVVTGSFTESDAIDGLEGNGFTGDDEYAGYRLLSRERDGGVRASGRVVCAVSGPRVVAAQPSFSDGEPTTRERVEALIDASEGEIDRYADTNEDMAVLVDGLGDGITVSGTTQEEAEETAVESRQFAGQVAYGQAVTATSDTTEGSFVTVFASSDDIDTDEVETWTETNENFAAFDNISISESGRVVTVTGENVLENSDENSAAAPNASFAYEYDPDSGEVEIRVRSGDTLDTDRVTIEGENFNEVGERWSDVATARPSSSTTEVSAGDTVTVTGATDDYLLEIFWTSADGESSSVIGTSTGSDRAPP